MDQVTGIATRRLPAGAPPASNRPRRVLVLVLGIIVLSLADLLITLAYLKAQWMMEANPVAAFLIRSTQSAWMLVLFKAATVGICVAVLYRFRRLPAGEVAAWCAMAILTATSVIWHCYSLHFENPGDLILAQSTHFDEYRLGIP